MNYQRKRVAKRLASGLLAGALALGGLAISGGTASATAAPTVETRIAGANRYATANAVALAMVGTRTDVNAAVLVSGENFPDGLAAAALAGAVDKAQGGSPMLLVPSGNSLDPTVLGTLTTIKTANAGLVDIIIVGGTSAVSAGVEAQLTASGYRVTRVSGADRYATANAVSAAVRANNGGTIGNFGGYRTAFLANGNNFPDALSASSWAYRNGHPIFLTDGTSLSDATKAAMTLAGVQQVVILGGESAVSAEVATAVAGVSGVITSVRIDGTDRYDTATKLASAIAAVDADYKTNAMLVSGTSFADALSAAQLAGQATSYALVPVKEPMPAAVAAWATANQLTLDKIRAIGGTSAVSAASVDAFSAASTIAQLTATITAADGSTAVVVSYSGNVTTGGNLATSFVHRRASGAVVALAGAPVYTDAVAATGAPAKSVLTLGGAALPGDTISIVAGAITNALGVAVATTSVTVTPDTTAPTATITAFPGNDAATAGADASVWVTLSANATGFVAGDLAVTKPAGPIGATVAVINACTVVGTTTTYKCTISNAAPLAVGDVVTLAAANITNTATIPVPNAAVSATVAADAVAPVMQSVRYSQGATGGVQASLTDVGSTTGAGKVTVTARAGTAAAGRAGNAWSITTTDGGPASAISVTVSTATKSVTISADATNDTAQEVANALNADPSFSALFVAQVATAGAVTGFGGAAASLTGGLDLLTLTLTFSEPLSAALIGDFTISNTEITGQASPTLVAAAATDAGRLTGVLTVTVQTSGAPLAGVSTVTAAAAVLDLAGNALVTTGTSHIVAMTPA